MIEIKLYNKPFTIAQDTIDQVIQDKINSITIELNSILDGTNRWLIEFPFMKSDDYVNDLKEKLASLKRGEYIKSLAFIQECVYKQTGESVPLIKD